MWKMMEYEEEYFQEMLDMTIEYYGDDNDIANDNFIRHEYFSNPAGDAFIRLAYDDDKQCLAGQYIVIPREYAVDGRTYRSVLSLNTLTREAYRGQQIFTKLADAVYAECSRQNIYFCYGAPNQNSFPGFIKKLSFRDMGEVPLYLKVLNPVRILGDKIHVNHHEKKEEKTLPEDIYGKDGSILRITGDQSVLFDAFWKKICRKYPIIGVRNAAYMKWRYLDMPLREYMIYMAMKKGEPCGYVVVRVCTVSDMRCGMIVDFLVEHGMEDAANLLLEAAITYFKAHKAGLAGCLMQRSSEESAYLQKKGFFICPKKMLPQPFPVIYRQFHEVSPEQGANVEDFSQWFFTMGDYDVI